MSNIVQLPTRGPVILTKAELAKRLKCSTRWIELRVKEGMPVERATDRRGRCRYDFSAVQDWLSNGQPKLTRQDRFATIEARLVELQNQLNELRKTA